MIAEPTTRGVKLISRRFASLVLLLLFVLAPEGKVAAENRLLSLDPQVETRDIQEQLIRAIWSRDIKTFESTLNQGLNPNFLFRWDPKDDPVSPLSEAISGRQLRMIALLFDHGALVNFGTDQGLVPIGIAARYGDQETVVELIRRGADVKVRDHEGYTPLLLAASRESGLEIIKLLLAAGASLDETASETEDTVVMAAAASLNVEAVRFFIDYGVPYGLNPCARNKTGKTARDFANQQILHADATAKLKARREILSLLRAKCSVPRKRKKETA